MTALKVSRDGRLSPPRGRAVWTLPLAKSVAMEFHPIPEGTFLMGARGESPAEEPRHLVRITRPFYMGVSPVTQEQFAVWAAESKVKHENGFPGRPQHPAESLDWYQAVEFCAWLNRARRDELPAGYVATLPTEAEWEYACRAGTDTEYYTGDGDGALDAAGWYDANSGRETRPVGGKAPNAFGLRDMHGNVWEWCWDVWDEQAYKTRVDGVKNPGATDREPWLSRQLQLEHHTGDSALREDDRNRVMRGGSWFNTARDCRSVYRFRRRPAYRFRNQGFRVCLVPGPVARKRQVGDNQRLETEPGGTPRRSRKTPGARSRR